nr:hypothetical protein CFP56_52568 [Quercus suber]
MAAARTSTMVSVGADQRPNTRRVAALADAARLRSLLWEGSATSTHRRPRTPVGVREQVPKLPATPCSSRREGGKWVEGAGGRVKLEHERARGEDQRPRDEH